MAWVKIPTIFKDDSDNDIYEDLKDESITYISRVLEDGAATFKVMICASGHLIPVRFKTKEAADNYRTQLCASLGIV